MTDTPAPKLDTYTLDVKATTPEDVVVPITVTIEYPAGMGAYAADVLPYLAERKGQIIMELVQRLDASALDRARAAGLFDDDQEA